MDFLEYSDIKAEIKGSMSSGKLTFTDEHISFKSKKTGNVTQIQISNLDMVNFQNIGGKWAIRIFLNNGSLQRFVGFKESDKEKIAQFFSSTYKIDLLEKELSVKGWNWGTAIIEGSVLSFNIGKKTAFEVPLNHVSQCTAAKNEIAMEFHQNDDAPVSLMEMRFFIPPNEVETADNAIESFRKQIMEKASVISVPGDAIAIFREIHCLTPRGRYDIKIFQTFFQLHGKTFDYKIPISTVLRLFLLPHKDSRQMLFVISLDPPIKQGQTRYHFLVLVFGQEEKTCIELPFTEQELRDKFEDELDKEISGPTYEVLGTIMKAIVNRKLTGPGSFVGHSGTAAISCSFKAAAGYLYPLEKGFMYVHKPPLYIRFDEVASVNFARGGGSTRSFDFEIESKSGTFYTFSSIEKEEYVKLFDFTTSKKLRVKNKGTSDKPLYNEDFGNSDNESAVDAYLERVKAEAQQRDDDDNEEDDDSSSTKDGSSTDDDFEPEQSEGDVSEDIETSASESSLDKSAKSDTRKYKKKSGAGKKVAETKKVKQKSPAKSRCNTKKEDTEKPKRALSAYMIWLNANRNEIKANNPGIKITEIAKKGGELWKDLANKSEWEAKAAKAKEDYKVAMKYYEESLHDKHDTKIDDNKQRNEPRKKDESQKKNKGKSVAKKSQVTNKTGAKSRVPDKKKHTKDQSSSDEDTSKLIYKSKEFVSTDESSSSDDSKKLSGYESKKLVNGDKEDKDKTSEVEDESNSD